MRLPDWLGFRGKTLWEWLQLLIVPAILIGVTFAWSATQTKSDNKRQDERIRADQAAAEEARQCRSATARFAPPTTGHDSPMADPVPAGSDVSAGTYKGTSCGYEFDV